LRHRSVAVETGITLNIAERVGTGYPVLCLHCAWGSWRNWLALLPPGPGSFAGRPIVLLDLRGHGGSSKPASGYRIRDYAADVLAFVWQEGLERFTLAGHSLGALISLLVAGQLPERIESLLLEDPPLPFPRSAADVDDYWIALGAIARAYLALKRQPRHVRIETLLTWEPGLRRAEAERFADALAETADGVYQAVIEGPSRGTVLPPEGLALDVPALAFQAGEPGARAFRARGVAQLRAVLPRLEVVAIPRTGHDVLRDDPVAYRAAVARYLEG
jgi:pimeloyl-ACP methyl ester carboxylesterase